MFYDSETEFDSRERRRLREMERQQARRRARKAKREYLSAGLSAPWTILSEWLSPILSAPRAN